MVWLPMGITAYLASSTRAGELSGSKMVIFWGFVVALFADNENCQALEAELEDHTVLQPCCELPFFPAVKTMPEYTHVHMALSTGLNMDRPDTEL